MRFSCDSPLEGGGFELPVPRGRPALNNTPKPNECGYFRRSDRHSGVRTWPIATGNRWFESISLQQGVSNELFPAVAYDGARPYSSPLRSMLAFALTQRLAPGSLGVFQSLGTFCRGIPFSIVFLDDDLVMGLQAC